MNRLSSKRGIIIEDIELHQLPKIGLLMKRTPSPYVLIDGFKNHNGLSFRTTVKKKTTNCRFEESFEIPFIDSEDFPFNFRFNVHHQIFVGVLKGKSVESIKLYPIGSLDIDLRKYSDIADKIIVIKEPFTNKKQGFVSFNIKFVNFRKVSQFLRNSYRLENRHKLEEEEEEQENEGEEEAGEEKDKTRQEKEENETYHEEEEHEEGEYFPDYYYDDDDEEEEYGESDFEIPPLPPNDQEESGFEIYEEIIQKSEDFIDLEKLIRQKRSKNINISSPSEDNEFHIRINEMLYFYLEENEETERPKVTILQEDGDEIIRISSGKESVIRKPISISIKKEEKVLMKKICNHVLVGVEGIGCGSVKVKVNTRSREVVFLVVVVINR